MINLIRHNRDHKLNTSHNDINHINDFEVCYMQKKKEEEEEKVGNGDKRK